MTGKKHLTRGNGSRSLVRTGDGMSETSLYRLMVWLSPAYPVGAFAYSSGIEWAVEAGDVEDVRSLQSWLNTILIEGAGACDGILFAQTHRAVVAGNDAVLAQIAGLAAAFAPTRERYYETTALGRAFIDVTGEAWPCAALARLEEVWRGPIAYPIAVAVACAGHGVPLAPALHAFLMAILSNWVSAAVRLIPLGHTDGQRVLQALEPAVAKATRYAFTADLDDVASVTFRADLASMFHETQYTRLFRS